MVRKWMVIPSVNSSVCPILWECVHDTDVNFWKMYVGHPTSTKGEKDYLEWDVKNDDRLFILNL